MEIGGYFAFLATAQVFKIEMDCNECILWLKLLIQFGIWTRAIANKRSNFENWDLYTISGVI